MSAGYADRRSLVAGLASAVAILLVSYRSRDLIPARSNPSLRRSCDTYPLVRGMFVVVRDGVDPSTSGFSDQHSSRLCMALTWENGGCRPAGTGGVGSPLVSDLSLSAGTSTPQDSPPGCNP